MRVTSIASSRVERRQDRAAAAARASSCRCPAGRSAAGCVRRPRRSTSALHRVVLAAHVGEVRMSAHGRRSAACAAGGARTAPRLAVQQPRTRARRSREPTATCRPSTSAASSRAARARARASAVRPARSLGDRERAAGRRAPLPSRRARRTARARRAARAGSWPLAASTAHASARSRPGPALRTSAGARLAVIRARRELEARVEDRRADALARLADRRVGEADDRERGQARADVDLDRDVARAQPVDRERVGAREHRLAAAQRAAAMGRARR